MAEKILNRILLLFSGEVSPDPLQFSVLGLMLELISTAIRVNLRSGLRRFGEGPPGRLVGKLEDAYLNGVYSSHMSCDLLPCVVWSFSLS